MNTGIRRLAAMLCLAMCLAMCAGTPGARADQADGKAEEITKKCSIRVSDNESDRGRLRDGNRRTRWTYSGSSAYVGVKLPDGVPAGWLGVEWLFDPTAFELIEYDIGMNKLRSRDQSATFPNICTMLQLLPETVYLQLKLKAKDQDICELHVYSAGSLPREAQLWNPPVEKADLMVVSTHQDDELVFMGGTIPYYAVARKVPTVVVYMTNCTRLRRGEALDSLWTMGVKDYPEFINLKDERVDSISAGVELWGGKEKVLEVLVERIRRFKPEVIVTHDLDGEYGHNQHKITARAMMYAIDAAADESRFPDSLKRYGAWQVKKLYHHLYKQNAIMMDWTTKLDSLHGYSPLKVAQIGMEKQVSQLKYYAVKNHGTYDNAKFGLYFTTVGEDVAKNDFLEHIDPNASANYLASQGAATAAPEPADEVVSELLDEVVSEPLDEAVSEPADEVVSELADDVVSEPLDEVVSEPVEAAVDEVVSEPVEAAVAEVEMDLGESGTGSVSEPQSAEQTKVESDAPGKSRAGTIVALAAGVAVLGAGGWFGWRAVSRRRRRRRRRRARRR